MAEPRVHTFRNRIPVALTALLLIGAPAIGQGPQGIMPPVPGPFPVVPGAEMMPQMPAQMPAPIAPPVPEMGENTPSSDFQPAYRPVFQPPANAMRLPYWMQAPSADAPEARQTAPVQAEAEPAPARSTPARAASTQPQAPAAGAFGQPMPFWAAPGYAAPGAAAQGYAPQAVVPQGYMAPGYVLPQGQANGQAIGTAPAAPATGWGAQQPAAQPGWGYGAAPGWGPMPDCRRASWVASASPSRRAIPTSSMPSSRPHSAPCTAPRTAVGPSRP